MCQFQSTSHRPNRNGPRTVHDMQINVRHRQGRRRGQPILNLNTFSQYAGQGYYAYVRRRCNINKQTKQNKKHLKQLTFGLTWRRISPWSCRPQGLIATAGVELGSTRSRYFDPEGVRNVMSKHMNTSIKKVVSIMWQTTVVSFSEHLMTRYSHKIYKV